MLANGENTTQDTTTLYSAAVVVKQHVLLVLSVILGLIFSVCPCGPDGWKVNWQM